MQSHVLNQWAGLRYKLEGVSWIRKDDTFESKEIWVAATYKTCDAEKLLHLTENFLAPVQ